MQAKWFGSARCKLVEDEIWQRDLRYYKRGGEKSQNIMSEQKEYSVLRFFILFFL